MLRVDAIYEDGQILTQQCQKSDNLVGFSDLLLNNKLYLYTKIQNKTLFSNC